MLQPGRVGQEWLLSAGKQEHERISEALDTDFCIKNYAIKAGDNRRHIYRDYKVYASKFICALQHKISVSTIPKNFSPDLHTDLKKKTCKKLPSDNRIA